MCRSSGCTDDVMHWALIALAVTACGDNLHATCAPCPSDPGACECPHAAPPPPSCDDGNPCTKDSVVGGMCRFDALPDGTPCDDGDLCTLGDRCQSGTCVAGPRASGELAILGSLDNLSGRRVPLGPGRLD